MFAVCRKGDAKSLYCQKRSMAGQGFYRSIRPKPVKLCVTLKTRNQFVELLLAHNTGGSI